MKYVVKVGPRYIKYVDSGTILAVPAQIRATKFCHKRGVKRFVHEFGAVFSDPLCRPRIVRLVPRNPRQ